MSPLGAGTEGYPDGQRVSNADGPLLYELVPTKGISGLVESERLSVSRYAALVFRLSSKNAQNTFVTLSWFSAKTGGVLIGERTLVLNQELGIGYLRLLNLGPWVQIIVNGEGVYFPSVRAYASNRPPAAEFIPPSPVVLHKSGSLAIKTGLTAYPSSYASGPAQLVLGGTSLAGVVALQALVGFTEWVSIASFPVAAAVSTNEVLILPSTAWRLEITNTAAVETNYVLAVTLSPTGSS